MLGPVIELRLTDTGTCVVILIRNSVINTWLYVFTITDLRLSPVSSLQSRCDRCQHSHCADVQRLPFPPIIFQLQPDSLHRMFPRHVASPITAPMPQSGQLSSPVWPQALQAISGSCCITGSGWFIVLGWFFPVSGWFWYTQSRVWIPFTHFGSFVTLRQQIHHVMQQAIYRHRQDFLMECFPGHGVLPAVPDISHQQNLPVTEHPAAACPDDAFSCVRFHCFSLSLFNCRCSRWLRFFFIILFSFFCYSLRIGAEDDRRQYPRFPDQVGTICSVSTLFRYSVTCAGMTPWSPIGASFTDATTMARE